MKARKATLSKNEMKCWSLVYGAETHYLREDVTRRDISQPYFSTLSYSNNQATNPVYRQGVWVQSGYIDMILNWNHTINETSSQLTFYIQNHPVYEFPAEEVRTYISLALHATECMEGPFWMYAPTNL